MSFTMMTVVAMVALAMFAMIAISLPYPTKALTPEPQPSPSVWTSAPVQGRSCRKPTDSLRKTPTFLEALVRDPLTSIFLEDPMIPASSL